MLEICVLALVAATIALGAGNTFGRQVVGNAGQSIKVSADGSPACKIGGVTIDWTSVTPLVADTLYNDGVQCYAGDYVLRYGQVICLITGGEINTATITGSPTGGTFTLTVGGQTTSALAYNAAAATVQAALVALSTVGAGGATVTGSAGGPYTISFATALGQQAVTASGASLTGGTSPGVTIATTSTGARNGMYGPYDPTAVDGRQTLVTGQAFILNYTMKSTDLHSNHPEAIHGGRLFVDRIIQSGVAAHSLAAGPTLAEVQAAVPFFPVYANA